MSAARRGSSLGNTEAIPSSIHARLSLVRPEAKIRPISAMVVLLMLVFELKAKAKKALRYQLS